MIAPVCFGLKHDFQLKVVPFEAFGRNSLIINENGESLEASNICSHMGMRFCEKANDDSKEIKCPFHGRSLGPKKKIFQIGKFLLEPTDDPVAFKMLEWISSSVGDEFQSISLEGHFPWYVWMLNTMDFRHLRQVHPGFQKVFPAYAMPYDQQFSQLTSSYKMPVEPSIVKSFQNRFETNADRANINDYFFHFTLYPNISITSFLGLLYSIEIIYSFGNTTKVWTRYFKSPNHPIPDAIIRAAQKSNQKILTEDLDICERVAPTYNLPESFLLGEERMKHFIDLMNTIPLTENPY